ncbi:hypothetical protein BD626DRAFT_498029 [Schizophyllum amplum]|uniref:ADF-H domain-containing protein n=1 Tax=Schizophyllum amplum TaxID=97359 RepID=A0A550CCW8_9AGAR|nr:hypothetical protein BD626DRAFT_498029 [Auriculariopsis ampla]
MATSGIGASQDLSAKFSAAVAQKSTRFLKIVIQNESLVHAASVPISGKLEDDLPQLQELLEDSEPAYVLGKLDAPSLDWLVINYVPDSAKVRDKMLYASTRNSLMRALGSATFSDNIYATSKADLTPEAYAAHLRHLAAPKPLSAREKEMEDVKAAEREGGMNQYDGARRRVTDLVNTGMGFQWSEDAAEAVKGLGEGDDCRIIVLTVEMPAEKLALVSSQETTVENLASTLPKSDPCYALFAWPHSHSSPPRREIVFIYSCPSGSPIKYRMMYASGALMVQRGAKSILDEAGSTAHFAARKIETSDPSAIDEALLVSELDLATSTTSPSGAGGGDAPKAEEKKAFAKPKGPPRRQR